MQAIFACFLALFFFSSVTYADEKSRVYTVTFSGEGVVTVEPDEAVIFCTISETSRKIGDAVAGQARKTAALLVALQKLNVAQTNIETIAYSYQPEYAQDPRTGAQTRTLIGYGVSQQLSIRTDVKTAGNLIEDIADIAFINAVQFTVGNTKTLLEEAKRLAVEDAKKTAEKRATQLGIKLGRILGYEEQSPGDPGLYRDRAMAQSASTPQLPVGKTSIRSTVSITYEILFQ